MREILFRGRTKQGEWVYGTLIPDEPWVYNHVLYDYAGITTLNFIQGGRCFHNGVRLVKRDTVGQSTGLRDKNGKRIYEGDIVKANNNKDFYKVYWEDYRFTIEDKWGNRIKPHQRAIDHFECEVVGNIYDNPEFLEGDI